MSSPWARLIPAAILLGIFWIRPDVGADFGAGA